MICFRAELADVPFEEYCSHGETENLFKEYFTDKIPEFVIDLSDNKYIQIHRKVSSYWERHPENSAKFSNCEIEALNEEGTLRQILYNLLSSYHVFCLHGSAICLDGEAYIFTASSGTGKSTHTRLWLETFEGRAWIINDDQPLIRIIDNNVYVYGSPWDGKHHLSRNSCAPLKAVAWLKRDAENRIEPISKATAFTVLLAQICGSFDKNGVLFVMQLAKNLLEEVSFYELHCNMESEAALISMQGMK